MTGALHPEHINRALQSGNDVKVGPWEVTTARRILYVYHYAHRLIRVVWPSRSAIEGLPGQMPDPAIPTLYAYPRQGYGFSKTDLEAIRMVAQETSAVIDEPEKLREGLPGDRFPYGVFKQNRPFPARRE